MKTGFTLTINKNWEKNTYFVLPGQVTWYNKKQKLMFRTRCWVKVSWDQRSKSGYISKLRTLSLPSETHIVDNEPAGYWCSYVAKQAARTLHENSRLELDHGLLAMPTSIRYLFWHLHGRGSLQGQAEGRRKNLGMMTVGATVADGRTVLLCGMIWAESKQAVPICTDKALQFFL